MSLEILITSYDGFVYICQFDEVEHNVVLQSMEHAGKEKLYQVVLDHICQTDSHC